MKIFTKYQINLEHINCIDVGGTPKVYLEVNSNKVLSWRRRFKNKMLRLLRETVKLQKDVIVTENPLIKIIPNLQFFDRGFNASVIKTSSDFEADFLVDANIVPILDLFDLVVSFDTLEHISDPFTFCSNLVRIAKPGAYIYLQTVFSWEYHPSPQDYFRFSPEGLRECFTDSTGEILECDWETEGVSVFAFVRKP
ncbi:methyltransferase domain-containing protein [Sphaerospermopsis aphanizomenoides BCCUSP55]|uniref:class I SAM-dependent methyltransferase n=1 Tax=Sphaerospermopsis aphanizomenoides TaxID=459663 RepID=UPI0019080802|nr:methyltransferase domain-containing protein [Sphaerospermopsis aphanizomenoides]MBK1989591.1 methyltransferase domain-containing protein [Sphaerospermopsis aphanizomenoides BCCUSP55]